MIAWRIGKGVLRPHLGPTLLTALMLPILIGLGTWQVQRLHWKEGLIATIDARIHQDPIDILSLPTDQADYHPVTATGVFQNDKNFYLLALSAEGAGGYHVLTPLQLADGQFLLVDRGWIPYTLRDRGFAKPEGQVSLSGLARYPEHHSIQSKNDPSQNNWYQIDLRAMAKQADIPAFIPFVLEQGITPGDEHFPQGGQTRIALPNNHLSYALTWYGLAIILVVIYLLSSYQKDAAD